MTRFAPALFAAAMMAAIPATAGGFSINLFPPDLSFPADAEPVTKSNPLVLETCQPAQKGAKACGKTIAALPAEPRK